MNYRELIAKLEAVEAATGLYLSDTAVDLENAGRDADDDTLFAVAYSAAQSRAEEAGHCIDKLLAA